jgi:hypothetical protein
MSIRALKRFLIKKKKVPCLDQVVEKIEKIEE